MRVGVFYIARLRLQLVVASGLDVIRELLIITTGIVGFRI